MLAFAALPKLATVSSKGYGPLRQLSRATTPLAESNGFRSKRHLNRLSNAALFPSNRVLGSKLALPLRTRRSQSLWHGGGHHHTHFGGRRDHPIKGHHPDVDPHHYNQVKDEDHEAGTQVTVLGIFINIGLSLGYVKVCDDQTWTALRLYSLFHPCRSNHLPYLLTYSTLQQRSSRNGTIEPGFLKFGVWPTIQPESNLNILFS